MRGWVGLGWCCKYVLFSRTTCLWFKHTCWHTRPAPHITLGLTLLSILSLSRSLSLSLSLSCRCRCRCHSLHGGWPPGARGMKTTLYVTTLALGHSTRPQRCPSPAFSETQHAGHTFALRIVPLPSLLTPLERVSPSHVTRHTSLQWLTQMLCSVHDRYFLSLSLAHTHTQGTGRVSWMHTSRRFRQTSLATHTRATPPAVPVPMPSQRAVSAY